jgi:hypothetical protein
MKNVIPIIFFIALLFSACGGKQTTRDEEKTDTKDELSEEDIESTDFEAAKDCDEFIDQYEKWMDNYLEFLEEYMKNPLDATLSEKYMKLANESIEWTNQWGAKIMICGSQEKYEKRFNEIGERAEKKLEELGLE